MEKAGHDRTAVDAAWSRLPPTPPAPEPTVTLNERLLSLAIIAAVVIGGWWFLFGRGSSAPVIDDVRDAQSYADEFGGSAGKYAAILKWTDCSALGRAFDDGKANFDANAAGVREVWLGQMHVTLDRMTAIGCVAP